MPKNRGGNNDENNLIWLFASEHAKAHYLYSKEHPHDSGMAYAGSALTHKDGTLLSDEEINEMAKLNSELQSKRVSGKIIQGMENINSRNPKRKIPRKTKRQLIGKIINILVLG